MAHKMTRGELYKACIFLEAKVHSLIRGEDGGYAPALRHLLMANDTQLSCLRGRFLVLLLRIAWQPMIILDGYNHPFEHKTYKLLENT